MDSTIMIYFVILIVSAIVYADSTARDRLEKFLNQCAPIYATIGFIQGNLNVVAGIATFISFAVPIFFAFYLFGIHGFIFLILQLIVFRCFEEMLLSFYISRKYIKPFCRDNPELGKEYHKMLSWLKCNPEVIKEAQSENDLFTIYEKKTGDNSYSKDNMIYIDASDLLAKPTPFNVMNNNRSDNKTSSTHHNKTNSSKEDNTNDDSPKHGAITTTPKYCSNCGKKLTDSKSKYCSSCGKKIIR